MQNIYNIYTWKIEVYKNHYYFVLLLRQQQEKVSSFFSIQAWRKAPSRLLRSLQTHTLLPHLPWQRETSTAVYFVSDLKANVNIHIFFQFIKIGCRKQKKNAFCLLLYKFCTMSEIGWVILSEEGKEYTKPDHPNSFGKLFITQMLI